MSTSSRGSSSRLVLPLSIFVFLIAVNGYFWFDYSAKKNASDELLKEKSALLGTTEDQKMSLEENRQKLKKFEEENTVLSAELASTTNKLESTETEILKYETERGISASTTADETEKSSAISRGLDMIKKALLPL